MKQEFTLTDPYEHKLHTYLWETDATKPKGVVMIIHGAGEYMERYDHFAQYLNSLGFHVIGNDMLGHGKNAVDEEAVYFDSSIGFHKVYEGVKTVRDFIAEHYPDLKVVMFAHSLGSFIGRYAILFDHRRYDAALFSGTGLFSPLQLQLARLLATIIAKIKGDHHVSRFFNRRIMDGHIRSMRKNGIINERVEWISQDRQIINAFKNDPLCGKPMTIGAQKDILTFLPEIQDKQRIKESASSTAIYFMSGELDGLGKYGADVKQLYNMYHDCGYSNVKYTILNNTRHEIINAIEREAHYRSIGDWMIRSVS